MKNFNSQVDTCCTVGARVNPTAVGKLISYGVSFFNFKNKGLSAFIVMLALSLFAIMGTTTDANAQCGNNNNRKQKQSPLSSTFGLKSSTMGAGTFSVPSDGIGRS